MDTTQAAFETLAISGSIPTIDSDDAGYLEQSRLLTPAMNGYRNISARTIFSMSSESSLESTDSAIALEKFHEIPSELGSLAAFKYLGFGEEVAAWLLDRYKAADVETRERYEFTSWATIYIQDRENDADNILTDWDNVMKAWGISEELRFALLDPEFDDIRLTATAKYWVIWAIGLRSAVLFEAFKASKKRQTLREAASHDPTRRAGAQYTGPESAGDESYEEPAAPFLNLRGGGEGSRMSKSEYEESLAPESYLTLWRGGAKAPFLRFMNDRDDDDDNDTSALECGYPSDFRGVEGPISYWALDRQVAQKYAKFHRRASAPTPVGLLRADIPHKVIDSLHPCVLRDGLDPSISDDWRKIIFASRRGAKFPKDLTTRGITNERELYIGYICKAHNEAISALPSWTNISLERHCMITQVKEWQVLGISTGEREAVKTTYANQYVFNGKEGMKALGNKSDFTLEKYEEP